MIFDVKNWLGKSDFGTFWHLLITSVWKIQWFQWTTDDFLPKTFLILYPPPRRLHNQCCHSKYLTGSLTFHITWLVKLLIRTITIITALTSVDEHCVILLKKKVFQYDRIVVDKKLLTCQRWQIEFASLSTKMSSDNAICENVKDPKPAVARLLAYSFRFLPYVWFGCFPYIPLP